MILMSCNCPSFCQLFLGLVIFCFIKVQLFLSFFILQRKMFRRIRYNGLFNFCLIFGKSFEWFGFFFQFLYQFEARVLPAHPNFFPQSLKLWGMLYHIILLAYQCVNEHYKMDFLLDISGVDFNSGTSLCFRVFMKFFNLNCMIKSVDVTVEFRNYKSTVAGALKIKNKYYIYGWPGLCIVRPFVHISRIRFFVTVQTRSSRGGRVG